MNTICIHECFGVYASSCSAALYVRRYVMTPYLTT